MKKKIILGGLIIICVLLLARVPTNIVEAYAAGVLSFVVGFSLWEWALLVFFTKARIKNPRMVIIIWEMISTLLFLWTIGWYLDTDIELIQRTAILAIPFGMLMGGILALETVEKQQAIKVST